MAAGVRPVQAGVGEPVGRGPWRGLALGRDYERHRLAVGASGNAGSAAVRARLALSYCRIIECFSEMLETLQHDPNWE